MGLDMRERLDRDGAAVAVGLLSVVQIETLCGLADEAGDVWVYSTPILRASDRASPPTRRRVLQVDYADFELPAGLRWLGVL